MRIHSRRPFVLATGIALLSCAAPRPTPETAEPVSNTETTSRPLGSIRQEASVVILDSLHLSLTIVDGSPGPGEPLTLELTVLNEGADAAIVDFANGQRYDFEVFAPDGTLVWHWAEDLMFTMALGRETVAPGEALRWHETLEVGLAAGSYRVVATLASMDGASVELVLTVEG